MLWPGVSSTFLADKKDEKYEAEKRKKKERKKREEREKKRAKRAEPYDASGSKRHRQLIPSRSCLCSRSNNGTKSTGP